MKIVDTLEETLGGEWAGLHGEVVTCDCYRLRTVPFQPSFVLDIGANVGTFSRFARELFPLAKIVAVEPDPENCEHFKKFTPDSNTDLLPVALGKGPIFHGLTSRNGSGETYLSSGLGYPLEQMIAAAHDKQGIEHTPTQSITLQEILQRYTDQFTNGLSILKVDCEGAENFLFSDPEAMELMALFDYIALEVHYYALTEGPLQDEVTEATMAALQGLEETHNCELEGVHFWATKKMYGTT